MVDVGFTVREPIAVEVENDPGVIATDEAFVTFQLKVLVPAEATIAGDEEKEAMDGSAAEFVVPDATDDDAELFPTLSVAVT